MVGAGIKGQRNSGHLADKSLPREVRLKNKGGKKGGKKHLTTAALHAIPIAAGRYR
jgi:hypothetical protein